MTDANSTLLQCEPFTRHTAYTLWRLQENPAGPNHKPVKVPVHYDGTTRHSLGRPARKGRDAIPPNPAPPLSAQQAAEWLAHHRASGFGTSTPGQVGYIGVGFRPENTGLVCVDLDDCVTDGQWNPGALALFARFPGALIETSVSGTGAHIWFTCQGAGPGRRSKRTTPLGAIEVYGSGQFIACGRVIAGDAGTDHTAAVMALVAEFWPAETAPGAAGTEWDQVPESDRARVIEELRSTFPHLDQSSYGEWTARGMALTTLGDEVGLPLWHELSSLHPDYDEEEAESKWFDLHADRTGYQALFSHAESRGWTNPRKRLALPSDAGSIFAAPLVVDSLAPGPAGMLLEPPPSRVAAGLAVANGSDLSFMAAAQGMIAATVASVETALMSPEAGIRIGYDTFKDAVCIAMNDEPWRLLRDTDYGRLRAAFERRGFKPVAAETMTTAVAMVAETNQFDSLQEWINSLQWDGVPRMATALSRYYGADDTPYARAVGEYAFTTLAGRAIEPGVKADMAIIMVGMQGAGKTSALEVLVPEPSSFGEVDLAKDDDVIARKLRGKCLVELAEMRGFKGRDADANKAWISRRVEEWTPKYKEFNTSFQRRCLIIGTANDDEQLDDPTGARRFLPIHVSRVDRAALAADRDQLWAEGAARFRQSGVAWEEAERLAKAEHHKFEVVDEMQVVVEQWLAHPPTPMIGQPLVTTPRGMNPIRGIDVLNGCWPMGKSTDKGPQMAVAKIMKRLGYLRGDVWSTELKKNIKMWKPPGWSV